MIRIPRLELNEDMAARYETDEERREARREATRRHRAKKRAEAEGNPYNNMEQSIERPVPKPLPKPSTAASGEPAFLKVAMYLDDPESTDVDGDYDENGARMPFLSLRNGEYLWQPTIEIATGRIVDWPDGTVADVEYTGSCSMTIMDSAMNVLGEWEEGPVPEFLSPEASGYGEYMRMRIEEGLIAYWDAEEAYEEIEMYLM